MQLLKPVLSASPLETSWEKSLTRNLQLEIIIHAFLRDHQKKKKFHQSPYPYLCQWLLQSQASQSSSHSSHPLCLCRASNLTQTPHSSNFCNLLLFSLNVWSVINKIPQWSTSSPEQSLISRKEYQPLALKMFGGMSAPWLETTPGIWRTGVRDVTWP